MEKKADQKPLYLQVRDYLLEEIKKMEPGKNRLPPEEELAKGLGTSRATVRQAMDALIREGYISRRQGKGNFGHPGATSLDMRFDINSDFRDLIQKAGGAFSLEQRAMRLAQASPRMVRRMAEVAQEQVLTFDWIYYKDGQPVIHCQVEVLRYLVPELPPQELTHRRLSDFLSAYCRVDISYTTTWLDTSTDPEKQALFGIPQDRAMLVWEEVFYDLLDRKICFNTIHFHPEAMDLSMLIHI